MVKANKARETVKAVGLSILFYFIILLLKFMQQQVKYPLGTERPKSLILGYRTPR